MDTYIVDTYIIVLDRDRRYRGQEVMGLDQVSREPCFELIDIGKLDPTCEHLFLNQFKGENRARYFAEVEVVGDALVVPGAPWLILAKTIRPTGKIWSMNLTGEMGGANNNNAVPIVVESATQMINLADKGEIVIAPARVPRAFLAFYKSRHVYGLAVQPYRGSGGYIFFKDRFDASRFFEVLQSFGVVFLVLPGYGIIAAEPTAEDAAANWLLQEMTATPSDNS